MFLDLPFAKAASLYMALCDLLTSPAMAIAVGKLTSLFWSFQLHGWSYCIPCIAFALHKMAALRARRAAGKELPDPVLHTLAYENKRPAASTDAAGRCDVRETI